MKFGRMNAFLIFAFIIGCSLAEETGPKWSYSGPNGPSFWSEIGYPECNGQSQTPIDFPPREEMIFDKKLKLFHLINFSEKTAYSMKVTNNGHTVTVLINGTMKVQGGGLPSTYYVAQLHWHWGHHKNEGSEHTYCGQKYPMELHVVTYNDHYEDLEHAFDKPDGLAVLGFFYEPIEINNCNYEPLLKHFPDIQNAHTEKEIPSFNVRHLFPEKIEKFYRYNGGLTTPPCHQSVTWSVFEEHIKISEEQLDIFRSIYEDGNQNKILVNHRPLQARNNRLIYINYNPQEVAGASTFNPVLPLFSVGVILALRTMYGNI